MSYSNYFFTYNYISSYTINRLHKHRDIIWLMARCSEQLHQKSQFAYHVICQLIKVHDTDNWSPMA